MIRLGLNTSPLCFDYITFDTFKISSFFFFLTHLRMFLRAINYTLTERLNVSDNSKTMNRILYYIATRNGTILIRKGSRVSRQ